MERSQRKLSKQECHQGHAQEGSHWDAPMGTTGDEQLAVGGTAATIHNMTALHS